MTEDPRLEIGGKKFSKANLLLKFKEMPVIISFLQAIPCHVMYYTLISNSWTELECLD